MDEDIPTLPADGPSELSPPILSPDRQYVLVGGEWVPRATWEVVQARLIQDERLAGVLEDERIHSRPGQPSETSGSPVPQEQSPASRGTGATAAPLAVPGISEPTTHRRRLLALATGGLLLLLAVVGLSVGVLGHSTAGSRAPAATPTATPTQSRPPDISKFLTPAICTGFGRALTAYALAATGRKAQYVKITDGRNAATYVTKYELNGAGTSESDHFTAAFAAPLATAQVAAGSKGTYLTVQNFRNEAARNCGLATQYQHALAVQAAAATAQAALITRASSAPWYPAFYNQIYDGVALRFIKVSSCKTTTYGICYVAKVIVRDGCSNLYVELALLDSSLNKIGYTNDVLVGLAPGDTGIMEFDDGARTSAHSQISKVQCT